jgi:excisionase family DNA binding protein
VEKLYSIEDAAKALGGLSPGTITVWLSKGKIQRTKVGRRTMIAESELQRILEVGGVSPARTSRRHTEASNEHTEVATGEQTESAVV